MWHDTGSGASELPSGGWLEPHVHAESPDTKRRLKNLLDATGLTERLVALPPRAATIEEVCRVHDRSYVDRIAGLSQGRGGEAGSEAPFGNGSFEIALLAAGGTITAIDAVLDGAVDNAYALVRPPGHHALPDQGMGFCLFGNVAVAVRHAQQERGVGRVAVVDWDVHHGNGTQAVFWEDASVLTISLHQDGLYPRRSGPPRGEREPEPARARRSTFRSPRARAQAPISTRSSGSSCRRSRLSAGADRDRLRLRRRRARPARPHAAAGGGLRRDDGGLLDAARLCDGRLVASHEGGYSAGHVPFCGLAVIEALSGVSAGIDDPFAYLAAIPGQELTAAQREAVDAAAALVEDVPR